MSPISMVLLLTLLGVVLLSMTTDALKSQKLSSKYFGNRRKHLKQKTLKDKSSPHFERQSDYAQQSDLAQLDDVEIAQREKDLKLKCSFKLKFENC